MRYSFDTYVLDLDRRELRSGDHAVAVEPQVFDLLAYLIRNRDRVITQDDLLAGVWKGRIVSESTLRSRINAARAAIGDNGEEQRLIRTLPRRGFRFVGPVHEQSGHATAADVAPSAGVPDPTLGAGREPAGHTPIEPMPDRASPPDVAGRSAPMPAGGRMVARPRTWIMIVGGIGLVAISAVLALLFVRTGTREPARMPPSAATEIAFDPSVVPLISDAARRSLANYRERPDAKALAIARGHMVVVDGAIDVEQAKAEALRRCGAGARPSSVCRIYAVGTQVVWSRESLPLPAPGELRAEPIDASLVADDVPTIPTATRNRIAERYVDGPPPKALALTTGGIWYVRERSSRAEAARLAVEECTDYWQRPCILLSVDGLLTIQIPKSRAVMRIFLPSTEDGMSDRDRQRVSEVYQGKEWRALARGKSGGWHPVAAAPSEAAAVEAALSQCAKSDTECHLHAIGNFHVSEESR